MIAFDKVLAKAVAKASCMPNGAKTFSKLQALYCGRRPELNSITSLCAASNLETCRKLRDKELCSATIDFQRQSVLVTNGLEDASIPQRLPPHTD